MLNNQNPDLNEVLVFVKVVQAGSFSQAARQLGMPNSTVSARVSGLERRLGVTLLQRTTRKLSLTEAGSAYFQRAAQGLDGILQAEAEVAAAQQEPQGLLRVTAPADMGDFCLVELLSALQRQHPRLGVEMVFTDRYVDLVAEGVDVAIRAGRLRDSSLVARQVGQACWVPFASPAYLKTAGALAHPKDLRRHTCLQFTPLGRSSWELGSERSSVTVPMDARCLANDMNLIKALALSGHGVALLPTYACHAEVQSGKLVRVLPRWRAKADPVHLVYPGQRFVPPKLRVFIGAAVEVFGRLLAEQHEAI
ncbi:LysR family transcriptional regulator [Variovorax terrae]|uniref:LysR family transcriptional regulator n=1 Tax=Variovorax terrae TaxID=2923278 RepID=A0A9X2AN54_9BURK|nr:LysR family transcriptional regulator [Variovorax terrae]MCJ0763445.1 LysR family transcriptional regulator [Variovorax terrae]